MTQAGFVMGFVHRRRRGAELFLLMLALGVGIGAYAAVGIGVEGEVPPDIVGYGAGLAALAIAAHVVVRIVAPYADPVLLPVVTALNGLGLAVIHRLDLVYADNPLKPHGLPQEAADLDDARRDPLHRHAGAAARPPGAGPLHLHLRAGRDRAAPAPAGPRNRRHHQRRQDLDQRRAVQLPARRGRQGAAGDRVRRLPRAAPRRTGARRPAGGRHRPAAGPRPRADPGDVADQPRHPGLPARPRLQPAVLRPVPGDALRRDRAARVARRRCWCCSWAAPWLSYQFLAPRPKPRQHLARPDEVLRPEPRAAASSSSPCSAWPGVG